MMPTRRFRTIPFFNIVAISTALLFSSCQKESQEGKQVVFHSIPKPIHSISSVGGNMPNFTSVFHRDEFGNVDSITYDDDGFMMGYTGGNITTIFNKDGFEHLTLTYTNDGLLHETMSGGDGFQKFVRYYDNQGILTKFEYYRNMEQADGTRAYEILTALDEINIGPTGGTLKFKGFYESEVVKTHNVEVSCLSRANNLTGSMPYRVLGIYSDFFYSFTNNFQYLITSFVATNAEDPDDWFGIYIDYTFNEEGNISILERSTNLIFMNRLTFEYVE